MINDFKELKHYLKADMISCGIKKITWYHYVTNPIIKFQRLLRISEYFFKKKNTNYLYQILYIFYWYRLQKYRLLLNFTIPLNVFGPGLSIAHYGTIVVNKKAKIGNNCRIHPGVCIGGKHGKAPVIGDNVYIGPGAKIFGDVRIGDNVAIGANSVVTKSTPDNVTIAGIPAKIISNTGSKNLCINGSELSKHKIIDWNKLSHFEAII